MKNKAALIEVLRCALINCDNIRKLGPVGIDIVKMQIEGALELLQDEGGGSGG